VEGGEDIDRAHRRRGGEVHVVVRDRHRAVTREVADRGDGLARHRQVRAERVPERVRAHDRHVRRGVGGLEPLTGDRAGDRVPLLPVASLAAGQHARRPAGVGSSELAQRGAEARRHAHAPRLAALGRTEVPLPVRDLDMDLVRGEVDAGPVERDDLADAKPRVAAEEHEHEGPRVRRGRGGDEALVVLGLIERVAAALVLDALDLRHRPDVLRVDRRLEDLPEELQELVDRADRELEQLDLLDLVVRDLVQAQRPEHREQVFSQVHVHVGGRARREPVRAHVVAHETLRELAERERRCPRFLSPARTGRRSPSSVPSVRSRCGSRAGTSIAAGSPSRLSKA
jgi:hypothetical protein